MAGLITFQVLNNVPVPVLSKWIRFKAAFPNSVIYDYKPSTCHKKGRLPYCANTIASAVRAFIHYGLAHKKGNHLILTAKKQVHRDYGGKKDGLWIRTNHKHDNELQLNYALLRSKAKRVDYAIKERRRLKIGRPRKTQDLLNSKKVNPQFSMSYTAMANYLQCSRYKARKLLYALQHLKCLTVAPRSVKILMQSHNPDQVQAFMDNYRKRYDTGIYYHKGLVVEVETTKVIIGDNEFISDLPKSGQIKRSFKGKPGTKPGGSLVIPHTPCL